MRVVKGDWNWAVTWNNRKNVTPFRCLDGHIKEHFAIYMAWRPDRRSTFFFSPPEHLCAVTYITEISLNVTNLLNVSYPLHSTAELTTITYTTMDIHWTPWHPFYRNELASPQVPTSVEWIYSNTTKHVLSSLSVCLLACLSVVNFNLLYNFWTVRVRYFIFDIYTPPMMSFRMTLNRAVKFELIDDPSNVIIHR